MTNKKRKIALLFAGGTHLLDQQDRLHTIDKEEDVNLWLGQMPELNIMVDIEPVFICGEHDNIDAHIWEEINKSIIDLAKKVDAFVVVTKLSSLVDTSLALAFGLQYLDKAIIVTSSQVDFHDINNKKTAINKLKAKNTLGLKSNLINALQASEKYFPIPAIMFGTRLIPATKAIWEVKGDADILTSIDGDYWAKVDFGINIKDDIMCIKKTSLIRDKIFAKILVIEDVPGVDWYFDKNSLKNYQAIIIKVAKAKDIANAKKQQLLDWDMPVALYNINLDLPSDKIASLINCTWNTALIKIMWILANADDKSNFKKDISNEYIGEFNI